MVRTLELPDAIAWTPELLGRLSPEFRYEVREGNLVVMSAAMRPWYAETRRRLCNLLVRQGRHAFIEQGVVLDDDEIRTCDVGVFAEPPRGDIAYHKAGEFTLLVEIVSATSRREDRELKPRPSAAAGVPGYWWVEEDADGEPVVYQHRLVRPADAPWTYAETRVVTLTALEES
ncbi:MAG: Uma2 family endonuclease [Streptosporangiales bacterium]|nr:Uma2 family endonuclease [Streptosporangiales bacterium]